MAKPLAIFELGYFVLLLINKSFLHIKDCHFYFEFSMESFSHTWFMWPDVLKCLNLEIVLDLLKCCKDCVKISDAAISQLDLMLTVYTTMLHLSI